MLECGGKRYNNEQEIIDAGCNVIYYYCLDVRGRWRDIEHLTVADDGYGYWYAVHVIKVRYEPELETVYLMRHSGSKFVKWYIDELVEA